MTHPLTPREKVARTVYDTVTRFDGDTVGTHLGLSAMIDAAAPTVDDERRIVKSVCDDIADSVLTALASGSGDHAELARQLHAVIVDPSGICSRAGHAIEALLAEIAALRARAGIADMLGEKLERRTLALDEAERKLAEAVDDERARGQVIIDERDKWIVELISERDEARAILRDAVSEAVPDAMIFAGHPDARRYSIALDDLRNWTARARTFLSKEAERG